MASGAAPYMGAVACPYSIPLGTLVEPTGDVKAWLEGEGMHTLFVCEDRMRRDYGEGYIDIALPVDWRGMTNAQRLKKAFTFGRKKSVWLIRIEQDERIKKARARCAEGTYSC